MADTHDKLITSATESQTGWNWKGDLRVIWSTLPSPEPIAQDHIQARLFNVSKDGEPLSSLGKLCQCSVTY